MKLSEAVRPWGSSVYTWHSGRQCNHCGTAIPAGGYVYLIRFSDDRTRDPDSPYYDYELCRDCHAGWTGFQWFYRSLEDAE